MKTKKFRPQGKWYRSAKKALDMRFTGIYNWHIHKWNPSHVLRVGGQLHYLADHAPDPIRKKWKPAFRKFIQRHRKF